MRKKAFQFVEDVGINVITVGEFGSVIWPYKAFNSVLHCELREVIQVH